MGKVFVSYRRDDSQGIVDHIHEYLAAAFRDEDIIIDTYAIPLGVDFREFIGAAIEQSDVVLVVIGNSWLYVKDGEGRRRLSKPDDLVRIEVEAALRRHIPVIPLLVYGASMPPREALPEGLRALVNRNAMPVRSGRDFKHDMARLIKELRRPLTESPTKRAGGGSPDTAALPAASGESAGERGECDSRDHMFSSGPELIQHVERPAASSELDRLLGGARVVSVEGLPGSGKSYLVAGYVDRYWRGKYARRALWFDLAPQGSLDAFLAELDVSLRFQALSPKSKCRELSFRLAKRKELLVVDDFQNASPESFAPLIDAVARYAGDGRLVLVSRTFADRFSTLELVRRLPVPGLGLEEIRQLLEIRGLGGLDAATLHALAEKTEGLPFAISVFATLVKDLGRRPRDLLAGPMIMAERFQHWFAQVTSLVGPGEQSLLQMLAVCDGPFNEGVVQMFAKEADIRDHQRLLERLQRSYLVQKYRGWRWKIHQLVREFCRKNLQPHEQQRFDRALANHYVRGRPPSRRKIMDHEEFLWYSAACRLFQRAGDLQHSEAILKALSRSVKARGYYRTLIDLAEYELRNNSKRSPWIDYDLAHCCLITGDWDRCWEVTHDLLDHLPGDDPDLLVATARLRAELLGSLGHALDGLRILTRSLSKAQSQRINGSVLSHAESVRVWLLTLLGDHREARALAESLLETCSRRGDRRGQAVALARLAILDEENHQNKVACEKFEYAARVFRECQDERGTAWCLSHLAACKCLLGDEDGAVENLNEGLQIKADIGECSTDYYNILLKARDLFKHETASGLINSEFERVAALRSRQNTRVSLGDLP